MRRPSFDFPRAMITVMGGMGVLAAGWLAADLLAQGHAFSELVRFNVNDARHLTNLLSRSSNQLVAVVFTTVAIAVPLTANMYSVKFLDLFVRDPVNGGMLTLVLINNLGVIWTGYGEKEGFVPVLAVHGALVLTITCFALTIPYLYYVFRFLHPNTLLARLEEEISDGLSAVVRDPQRGATSRDQIGAEIEHLANVAIRSVDRADRGTAIESVLTLERVTRGYWSLKPDLPNSWFEADANLFLGFSSKAVAELAATRSWMEMKVFSQLRQVMSAAIPRMHDVVSTIAKVSRKLGAEKVSRADPALGEMVVGYFNTFLRLALSRRDVRSLFIIFDQYRTLAEALCPERPEDVAAIVEHFAYYGQVAREQQMPFAVELVAHDLGVLVEHAWETKTVNRQELLGRFLAFDAAAPPLPGVKKAQALVASYFLSNGEDEAAARIARSFGGVSDDFIAALRDELLRVTREKYWEVNERRMNIDYIPEPRREKLREFFARLAGAARSTASSSATYGR